MSAIIYIDTVGPIVGPARYRFPLEQLKKSLHVRPQLVFADGLLGSGEIDAVIRFVFSEDNDFISREVRGAVHIIEEFLKIEHGVEKPEFLISTAKFRRLTPKNDW